MYIPTNSVFLNQQNSELNKCKDVLATHVFQSFRLWITYFIWKDSPAALNFISSSRRRTTYIPDVCRRAIGECLIKKSAADISRSSSVKNLAVVGKSGMIQKDMKEIKIVANPSRMNIHCHPGQRKEMCQ